MSTYMFWRGIHIRCSFQGVQGWVVMGGMSCAHVTDSSWFLVFFWSGVLSAAVQGHFPSIAAIKITVLPFFQFLSTCCDGHAGLTCRKGHMGWNLEAFLRPFATNVCKLFEETGCPAFWRDYRLNLFVRLSLLQDPMNCTRRVLLLKT